MLKQFLTVLNGGALEAFWRHMSSEARGKKVDLLEGKHEVIQAFVLEYLHERMKKVTRPKWLLDTATRCFNYVYADTDKIHPLKTTMSRLCARTMVKRQTKVGKKNKAIIPVFTMLVRIVQVWGEPIHYEEDELRTVIILVLCLVKVSRKADVFSIDRDKVVFGEDFIRIPMLKTKGDITFDGSISVVWQTDRANPFDLIPLLKRYFALTNDRFVKWKENGEEQREILRKRGEKSEKQKVIAEMYEEKIPMFFHVNKPMPLASTSYDTMFRKLMKEIGIVEDDLQRKVTPGAARKSGRMVGKKHGYDRAVLDVIGQWKLDDIPQEYYEDFVTPRDFSDVILESEKWKQLRKKDPQLLILQETKNLFDPEGSGWLGHPTPS